MSIEAAKMNTAVRETIGHYKTMLLENFEKQKKYIDTFSSLFCPGFDYSDILNNIYPTGFRHYEYKGNPISIKPLINFKVLDDIDYTWNLEEDYHRFFLKKEYLTYEEALDNFPLDYYFQDRNTIKKIDEFLISNLDGFNRKTKDSYEKEIWKNTFLKFNCAPYKRRRLSLQIYHFPSLSIIVDGQEFEIFEKTDLTKLLLNGVSTFHFFYMQSVEIAYDQNGNLKAPWPKTDEPVIYSSGEKFIVSNSYENLRRFNKYIFIITDLFDHYFRIFTDWLINILLPRIKT